MSINQFFLYLAVMAIVTYLVRVIPLVAIKRKISNQYVNSFLAYIPYTVLGAMTFPSVIFSTNSIPSATFASALAIALAFWGKSLIQVAVWACLTALSINLLEIYF